MSSRRDSPPHNYRRDRSRSPAAGSRRHADSGGFDLTSSLTQADRAPASRDYPDSRSRDSRDPRDNRPAGYARDPRERDGRDRRYADTEDDYRRERGAGGAGSRRDYGRERDDRDYDYGRGGGGGRDGGGRDERRGGGGYGGGRDGGRAGGDYNRPLDRRAIEEGRRRREEERARGVKYADDGSKIEPEGKSDSMVARVCKSDNKQPTSTRLQMLLQPQKKRWTRTRPPWRP